MVGSTFVTLPAYTCPGKPLNTTSASSHLEQTVFRAPSDGYVTQVLARPGTTAVRLPFKPVMIFIPQQKRQVVAVFRQNAILRLEQGDEAIAGRAEYRLFKVITRLGNLRFQAGDLRILAIETRRKSFELLLILGFSRPQGRRLRLILLLGVIHILLGKRIYRRINWRRISVPPKRISEPGKRH
jgi:hypothetical protein